MTTVSEWKPPTLAVLHAAKVAIDFDADIADAIVPATMLKRPNYQRYYRSQVERLVRDQLNPALASYLVGNCGPIPRRIMSSTPHLRSRPRLRDAQLQTALSNLFEHIAAQSRSSPQRSETRKRIRQAKAFIREFVVRDAALARIVGG